MADFSKIYLFLQKQGGISAADGYKGASKDGVIIKSEITNFLMDNVSAWNGEQSTAKSIVDQFWDSIDTNKTGKLSGTTYKNKGVLDKNEMKRVQDKIKVYEAFDEYMKSKNIEVPSVLTTSAMQTQFRTSLRESLANSIQSFIEQGGTVEKGLGEYESLTAFLDAKFETAVKQTLANCCADEYINSSEIQSQLKGTGYVYDKGTELYDLISNYVQNVGDDDDETIKTKVQILISQYLQTGDINISSPKKAPARSDEDPATTALYTYTQTPDLNELQRVIIKSRIESNLESLKNEDNYKKYSAVYENAIQNFINELLANSSSSQFSTIKGYGVNEFKNSNAYKTITNTIAVEEIFASDDLNNKIATISTTVADSLKGLNDIAAFQQLKNDIIARVQNGEFTNADGSLNSSAVTDEILSQIKKNLANFLSSGLEDLSIEELNTVYKELENSAEDISSLRNAAIMYCKAIVNKSDAYKNAVVEIFGSNYSSAIDKMQGTAIINKMNILLEKINALGDVSTFKSQFPASYWNNLPDNIKVWANSSEEQKIGKVDTFVKIGTSQIGTKRITFDYDSTYLSIDSSGNVKLNTSLPIGQYPTTVSVLIDGVVVSTKSIIIEAVAADSTKAVNDVKDWDGFSTPMVAYGSKLPEENVSATKYSFKDLYNKDAIIVLRTDMDNSKHWSKVSSELQTQLQGLADGIVTALATAGLSKSILSTAATNVVNRYISLGENRNDNDKGTSDGAIRRHLREYMEGNRVKTGHCIWRTRDDDGADSYATGVHFKDLVDDILEEYQRLANK